MWNFFGQISGKQFSIYIIIFIILIYVIYTIYLVATVHKTNALNSRFWEETLLFSFAFSFGMCIPGYHLNKNVNYTYLLFIFLFNILFNISWEISGFYNYLYPYDPSNITCPVKNKMIDLTSCYEEYNKKAKPIAQTLYLYMFIFLLGSILFLAIMPNIFSLKSSVPPEEHFHFIDVLYLSLINGIIVLLAIQYINVRRGDELLPSYESAVIIGKFIIFHIGLRFAGFL